MASLQNTTINGTLSTSGSTTVSGGIGIGGNVYGSGNLNIASTGSTGIIRVKNFTSYVSREFSRRGRLPLSFLSNISGTNLHSDEIFASGNNGINVYNNFGGSAVTITRETGSNVPNTTGVWLRINTDSSNAVTPGLGGRSEEHTSELQSPWL